VCAGSVGDCTLDPHVWPHRLTENHYRDFLSHDLPKLLEDIPLAARARMWCMQDDVPAHFSLSVRQALSNTSHDRRIGTRGLTAWSPSSPDLNPLISTGGDNYETLTCAAPVDNEEALHHRSVDVCQITCNNPARSGRMRPYMTEHIEGCTESHGGYFERLS
jgi:hypothetical protein